MEIIDNTSESASNAPVIAGKSSCKCAGGKTSIRKLRMNSYENVKKSYLRIIKEYDGDELEADKFRNLIYAFSKYLEFLKFEKQQEIEKRLAVIEEKINDK